MKIVRMCFLLAGLLACAGFVAAGFAVADTYQNLRCMPTPGSVCPSPCGCPIEPTPSDLCNNVIPPPGWTLITYYLCAGSPNSTCTSPALDCATPTLSSGGTFLVYIVNCECWKCRAVGNPPKCWDCPPNSPCIETNKPNFCGQYGCQTP